MLHIVPHGGGLDSTAVIASLIDRGQSVHAVHVCYGQKAAVSEWDAVQAIAGQLNKLVKGTVSAHSLATDLGFSKARIMHGEAQSGGVDESEINILELRNPVLYTQIASWAASKFPGQKIAIHLGFHVEPEGSAFADAMPEYLKPLEKALNAAISFKGTRIEFVTPFVDWNRSAIYEYVLKNHVGLLDLIHSCYEETPCGVCAHCTQLKDYAAEHDNKSQVLTPKAAWPFPQ